MEQLGTHWTDFHGTRYLSIFRKSVEKIQLSLKSDNNNEYFTWRFMYFFIISRSVLFRIRNVPDKSSRENQNTHFAFNNFFFENRAVYEIGWKNTVKAGRPQMTVWRMRITCWIPKATNTHSKYVILIVFPLQQWLHGRAWMFRYTYIARLVIFLHYALQP